MEVERRHIRVTTGAALSNSAHHNLSVNPHLACRMNCFSQDDLPRIIHYDNMIKEVSGNLSALLILLIYIFLNHKKSQKGGGGGGHYEINVFL